MGNIYLQFLKTKIISRKIVKMNRRRYMILVETITHKQFINFLRRQTNYNN